MIAVWQLQFFLPDPEFLDEPGWIVISRAGINPHVYDHPQAANINWADCDFEKREIVVRGDPETGTKNWTIRRVPMIPDMIELLQRLRAERQDEPASQRVMRVRECQIAINSACKKLGIARFTHHDLRHLFATLCIESGVDIPTVSRWLGHKDGGALAMKVYGHLRDQHSVAMAQRVTFGNVSRRKNEENEKSEIIGTAN